MGVSGDPVSTFEMCRIINSLDSSKSAMNAVIRRETLYAT